MNGFEKRNWLLQFNRTFPVDTNQKMFERKSIAFNWSLEIFETDLLLDVSSVNTTNSFWNNLINNNLILQNNWIEILIST